MTLEELKKLAEAVIEAQRDYLEDGTNTTKGLRFQLAAQSLRDALPGPTVLKLLEIIEVQRSTMEFVKHNTDELDTRDRIGNALERAAEIERSL